MLLELFCLCFSPLYLVSATIVPLECSSQEGLSTVTITCVTDETIEPIAGVTYAINGGQSISPESEKQVYKILPCFRVHYLSQQCLVFVRILCLFFVNRRGVSLASSVHSTTGVAGGQC